MDARLQEQERQAAADGLETAELRRARCTGGKCCGHADESPLSKVTCVEFTPDPSVAPDFTTATVAVRLQFTGPLDDVMAAARFLRSELRVPEIEAEDEEHRMPPSMPPPGRYGDSRHVPPPFVPPLDQAGIRPEDLPF